MVHTRDRFGSERASRTEGRPESGRAGAGEGEFWSVWSEDGSPAGNPEPQLPEDAPPRPLETPPRPSVGSEPGPGQARLFLNLGRKDDATAEEVSQLFRDLGVELADIDVDVMNTHTYINVPAAEAERLCAAINGQDRQGRRLNCEPARPRRR